MSNHGPGCVCWRCEGERETKQRQEHESVSWEYSEHGPGCVCWRCEGYRNNRHRQIHNKYRK